MFARGMRKTLAISATFWLITEYSPPKTFQMFLHLLQCESFFHRLFGVNKLLAQNRSIRTRNVHKIELEKNNLKFVFTLSLEIS